MLHGTLFCENTVEKEKRGLHISRHADTVTERWLYKWELRGFLLLWD